MRPRTWLTFATCLTMVTGVAVHRGDSAHGDDPPVANQQDGQRLRVATFNVSLNRPRTGQLIEDLSGTTNEQARKVAEIIQRVRPDVLLLNEFDFDKQHRAAELFHDNYLIKSQNGAQPMSYAHRFLADVNTGQPSGFDLDRNGEKDDPADAFGYGQHPGQFGMLVLSTFPITDDQVRTFQKFLWKDMPGATLPQSEDGSAYYDAAITAQFRLSSKSHWDIPIRVDGQSLHFLVSHPTPPVFDGPEDRNGLRNRDEIRFWADYLQPSKADYIYDDQGTRGGLPAESGFVIAGDQNADPHDGASVDRAIDQLLKHERVYRGGVPSSAGAAEASRTQGGANEQQQGDPAHDTADFSDRSVGNLRVDYVLPGANLVVVDQGVYWPTEDSPYHNLITASDHRLVWVDIQLPMPQ